MDAEDGAWTGERIRDELFVYANSCFAEAIGIFTGLGFLPLPQWMGWYFFIPLGTIGLVASLLERLSQQPQPPSPAAQVWDLLPRLLINL